MLDISLTCAASFIKEVQGLWMNQICLIGIWYSSITILVLDSLLNGVILYSHDTQMLFNG
jgi:hypothetical protein